MSQFVGSTRFHSFKRKCHFFMLQNNQLLTRQTHCENFDGFKDGGKHDQSIGSAVMMLPGCICICLYSTDQNYI